MIRDELYKNRVEVTSKYISGKKGGGRIGISYFPQLLNETLSSKFKSIFTREDS